jgi:hypothetical protein
MERSEISRHEVTLYRALLASPERWFTNQELSEQTKLPGRTVRLHTHRFVELGMLDLAEVFPAHKYRWSSKSGKRNAAYLQRLQQADGVFG